MVTGLHQNLDMSVLTTISPISSRPIIETAATTLELLDQKILPAAVNAQALWAKKSLEERQQVIAKFNELLVETDVKEKLAREITEQMGRPIRYTPGELDTAKLRSDHMLSYSSKALEPYQVDPSKPGFKQYMSKDPRGVVLIIFPWNYPYLCLVNGLIPALLVGNSVLIKPSPQTPKVADAVVSLLEQAGLPKGVVQAVHSGDNELLEKLVQRKEIAAVSFTGSVAGGFAVQKAAVNRTIPITLELGGNDAAYVRSDIKDIKATAADIVDGAIFNTGQSCCSIERVYVHEKVYDEFVKATVAEVEGYVVGDPFDKATQIGPLISERAARNVKAQIRDAVDRGAKKLISDEHFAKSEQLNSTFVGPQVLVDLDETSLVVQEETFGPVIPIIKVSSDEEAIAKINDSEFGLTASVWTADLDKGEELGNLIEAGTVFVNRSDYPDPALGWIGYKNSGRGMSLSPYGFDFWYKWKSHHIKAL